MDDTTTADQQAVHRWRLGVICNPGHFLDIEAPAHLPADNTSDTSMASAMMTAKPLTTSRAHAALRTQVGSVRGCALLHRPIVRAVRCNRMIVRAADTAAVLEDVRKIIAEQLGTDQDKVQAGSKFVDLGADSLDTVEIMMALEEKFELTLDEEGAEKITTVQEAADLITEQVNKA